MDGILEAGTSGSTALCDDARAIVEAVTPTLDNTVIIAVDIPNGIDPDDGSVPNPVVLAADVTVTFGGYKAGQLIAPGSIMAGRVRLVDIGITADLENWSRFLSCQSHPAANAICLESAEVSRAPESDVRRRRVLGLR